MLGFRNDATYVYADLSTAQDGCRTLKVPALNGTEIPPQVPVVRQSSLTMPIMSRRLKTLFGLEGGDIKEAFQCPVCAKGKLYDICWPTIAPSSVAYYANDGIPGWEHSLLITNLKRGLLFRVRLDPTDRVTIGDAEPMFRSQNRYRKVVFSADGRTIYVATRAPGSGLATNEAGSAEFNLDNPGSILAFTCKPK